MHPAKLSEYNFRTNWKLVLAVALFLLLASRGPMIELVLPCVSTRYDWSLRQVAGLDAIKGTISLVLAAIVLPATVVFIRARTNSVFRADGIIAQYSCGAICLGSIVIGLADRVGVMITGWVIYAIGFGCRISIVALATGLLRTPQFARLNTITITVDTIADLSLSPAIWQAWRTGLNAGGVALGLPWFIVAITMLVASAALIPLFWVKDTKEDSHSSTS